jgi:hypothetical protein
MLCGGECQIVAPNVLLDGFEWTMLLPAKAVLGAE